MKFLNFLNNFLLGNLFLLEVKKALFLILLAIKLAFILFFLAV